MGDGFGVALAVDFDLRLRVFSVVDLEGLQLGQQRCSVGEFGWDLEEVVFDCGGEGVQEGELGDVEEVYGQGVVVGGGDGCAAGEEDAFETAYSLAVGALVVDDFFLDEFEDGGAEAGCVGYGADGDYWVEAAEVGQFGNDGLSDLGVAGAEGEDFGKG